MQQAQLSFNLEQVGVTTVSLCPTLPLFNVGTVTKQTSNFNQFQNIDGVMGLAGPPSENNMFQSLVAAGKIEHDLFAMCLRPGAKSNGTLTIGSVDPRLQSGPFVYVPNEGMSQGFYSVAVQSINIGAQVHRDIACLLLTAFRQPVEGSAMTFIIDSGTNVFLAPQSLFHNIQKSFQVNCSRVRCCFCSRLGA